MDALAVILEEPERIAVRKLALADPCADDLIVDVRWSGISTGTEKLLWSGRMPAFPGMGYPLVPGYESVGRVVDAGSAKRGRIGEWVFVPGASCYKEARGLFGGTASRVIVPSARALSIDEGLAETGVLCALAATAHHALSDGDPPDLIVGHGVLGRLMARLTIALGAPPPTVWDIEAERRGGGHGYSVIAPDDDERRDYRAIYDASGFADGIDTLVGRLGKRGEIVLAGFYADRVSFAFPNAFRTEARLRVAAEWQPSDLASVRALVDTGALDFADIITDVQPARAAATAYRTAFQDADCLKMVLDWSEVA